MSRMLGRKLGVLHLPRYSSMPQVLEMPLRFRLQELLDSRDPPMSQSELARRSGISLVTINAIANNRTKQVSLETLDNISGALAIFPGELFKRVSAKGKRG